MTSEEERLAEAAAFGRRMADETCAEMQRQRVEHERLMEALRHQPPTPPVRRADLGEALLRLCQARAPRPDPPPRPRLVLVKS